MMAITSVLSNSRKEEKYCLINTNYKNTLFLFVSIFWHRESSIPQNGAQV